MDTARALHIIIIAAVVLAAVLGAGYWYIVGFPGWLSLPAPLTTAFYDNLHIGLQLGNKDYASGTNALRAGNYEDAMDAFKQALAATDGPESQVAIKSKIGISAARAGDTLTAISVFKEIAASPVSTVDRARAYAIQQLGYAHYYNGHKPEVEAALFADAEYARFVVQGDALLSARNIFEYAASIYPLAEAEIQVANYYANQLVAHKNGTKPLEKDTLDEYWNEVQDRFRSAEKDIAFMRQSAAYQLQLWNALGQKALVLGKLTEAGYVSESETNAAFEEIIPLFATLKTGADGNSRYYYAVSVARIHGQAGAEKVRSLLRPLYTDPQYKGSFIEKTLSDPTLGIRKQARNITLLSSLDSAFKDYLVRLGWSAEDFAAAAAAR